MISDIVAELVSAATTFVQSNSSDLQDLLQGGAALLQGRSVYRGTPFVYPFPMAIVYAPLALLPLWLAWGVVLIANLAILISIVGRRALLWILYVPVFQVLLAGQNDLWFLLLERHLKRGTGSAILAALTTLKPQLAFILLPFHLQRWWREDRRTLATFAAFTAMLWLAPWPHGEWLAKTQNLPNRFCAPSIWAACRGGVRAIPLPTLALAALSLSLIYVALKSKREAAIPALQLAGPVGMGQNTSLLIGLAPAWLMLPLAWVLGPLFLVNPSLPFVAYGAPLAVLLYQKYGSSSVEGEVPLRQEAPKESANPNV